MDRMEIRKAVQAGQVEEAIDKVNDLNPEVRRASDVVTAAAAFAATASVLVAAVVGAAASRRCFAEHCS
jgi:hypothetical protein